MERSENERMNKIKRIVGPPQQILNVWVNDYCNKNCAFCKATGIRVTDESQATSMTMGNLDRAIDFCTRSGVRGIRILGMEPAHHPQILEVIARIYERGFYVDMFFTNGIFDNAKLIDVLLKQRINININYFPKEDYADGQLEMVHNNMEALFLKNEHFNGEVGQQLVRFVNGALSITFHEPHQEYKYIIDACLRYQVDGIRWAVSRSSLNRENKYATWEQTRQMVPLIVDFVKEVAKNGIATVVECPLTPCLFTKRQLRFLAQFVADFKSFRCYPMLDVLPDLSVHYCMGIPIMGRITEKNTLREIYLDQVTLSEHFRKRVRAKECLRCEWWLEGLCQGYCLQDKYDVHDIKDKELLVGLAWFEERKERLSKTAEH